MRQKPERMIQQAQARARRMAPSVADSWPALTPLTDEELEAPIEVPEAEGAGAAVACPSELGNYRILEEISSGGQATVYRASDSSSGETVAVKLLHHGAYFPSAQDSRFAREKRFLAKLDHPNIVRLRDHGRSNGVAYLVMDYVEGRNLDEYLAAWRTKPGYVQEVLRIFAKLAWALHAAHRTGIIHRDLKPSNVKIQADGEPIILDFGLAFTSDMSQWQSLSTLTTTGQVVGSLPWSSPEQVSGGTRPVDQRTDIYSLGVMLYEELAGRFPYGTTGVLQEVIRRIIEAKPEPLELRVDAAVEGEPVVPLLAPMLKRLLAKAASGRYGSAQTVAQELERAALILAGRPIPGARRRRWLITTSICAILLATLGIVAAADPAARERPRFVNSIGLEFVHVDPGVFMMGNPDDATGAAEEGPLHRVRLTHGFYMAATVPTEAQYQMVMGRTGRAEIELLRTADYEVACCCSWNDANEFCRLLSAREGRHYRLPTEAEWEYVCRTGTDVRVREATIVAGPHLEPGEVAPNRLHVRHGEPNAWGFYDMPGLTWEWCSDYFGPYTSGEVTDPQGPASGRLRAFRGGLYLGRPGGFLFAARGGAVTQTDFLQFSVRLVLDAPGPDH